MWRGRSAGYLNHSRSFGGRVYRLVPAPKLFGSHRTKLIRFELVEAIDDQHVDGSSIGHYFKAELFLKRCKD